MNRQMAIWIIALGALAQPAGTAPVPNPKVIGPVPATVKPGDPSHDYPFSSSAVDPAGYGYIEEEFFFEGMANRYNTPALATGSVVDSSHPYRTRMVVRRPASADNFNGTVLMEVYANGPDWEHDVFWLVSWEHVIRRGYAWVGVSVQRLGIHQPVTGLRDWIPSRYGTLDVTKGGTILDDALAYDIVSQAAQAIKRPKGVDPMSGLHVERLFAAGGANAANLLAIYHNSIHPLAGVLDGFMLSAGGGQLRTDLDVRVFKVLPETSVANNQAAIRQPDSAHFRSWELAGTATVDLQMYQRLAAVVTRDYNLTPAGGPTCDLPPLSRIPVSFVRNAAVDHLVRWVRDNIEPPRAPEIELVTLGPPVAVARDSFGNTLGGVRLPQHAVPSAANTGGNSGPGLCRVYGSFQPFDDSTLNALYPDYKTYVVQFMQATDENLWHGFLVPEDAIETIREAVYSDRGRH